MKTFVTLVLIGLAGMAYLNLSQDSVSAEQLQFDGFIQNFNADYKDEAEYQFRLKVFKENLDSFADLNAKNPNAKFGVTQFADRTPEEFLQFLSLHPEENPDQDIQVKELETLESGNWDVSWVKLMGNAKNQGQCGSCWAFGVAALAEGRYALHKNRATVNNRFSEQVLVDCVNKNYACNGGFVGYGLEYWYYNDITKESAYPYTASKGECKDNSKSGITFKYARYIPPNNVEIIKELHKGPVLLGIAANALQGYQGGIIDYCPGNINHAVNLIGFTQDEKSITIRNSWSKYWGESGNFRINASQNTCQWISHAFTAGF